MLPLKYRPDRKNEGIESYDNFLRMSAYEVLKNER